MSGGHYDYKFGRMNDLVAEIRRDCVKYAKPSKDKWGYDQMVLPPDIIVHMASVANQIEKLAEAARDIEWYMSGDYGDDTFREKCASWNLSACARRVHGVDLLNATPELALRFLMDAGIMDTEGKLTAPYRQDD